jgi:hypothetical protein
MIAYGSDMRLAHWHQAGLLVVWTLAAVWAQPVRPVVWSAKLQLQSLDGLPARLERPFPDPVRGRLAHQTATIANCDAYVAETHRGFRAASDRDQRRLQFLGADCRALELLQSARPSRRSALGETPLLPRFLPPTLGFLPSEESHRRASVAQARGLSWKDTEPDLRVTSSTPDQTVIETPAGYVRLEWYARGDFNGDGIEDLLVRVASYAKQGTYARIRLVLLTRTAPDEILRVLREFD